jgi:hypothetical protein
MRSCGAPARDRARYFRTADPRASRTDRLRFELADRRDGGASATLLDRAGNPMPCRCR